VSFLTADDTGGNPWKDPDHPTDAEIEALLAAYIEARKVIARLEAEIARLNGEQEVVE
jgi:hypothetical protein